MTEKGKAVHHLDGAPDVTEEVILPVLSDTSVWERTMNVSATENSAGKQVYTSEYGKVTVDAPGESPVVYPKSLKFTGTVTATLCDSEMNGICTVKCEA